MSYMGDTEEQVFVYDVVNPPGLKGLESRCKIHQEVRIHTNRIDRGTDDISISNKGRSCDDNEVTSTD